MIKLCAVSKDAAEDDSILYWWCEEHLCVHMLPEGWWCLDDDLVYIRPRAHRRSLDGRPLTRILMSGKRTSSEDRLTATRFASWATYAFCSVHLSFSWSQRPSSGRLSLCELSTPGQSCPPRSRPGTLCRSTPGWDKPQTGWSSALSACLESRN